MVGKWCDVDGLSARGVAKYFSLSDNSLHFVKLTLPDGQEVTLPNVLSASGARYTSDTDLTWWTKGDVAFAEQRGLEGQWQTLYEDCRVISREDR
jgi:membrane-bound inhibitor of C-type lysozyme